MQSPETEGHGKVVYRIWIQWRQRQLYAAPIPYQHILALFDLFKIWKVEHHFGQEDLEVSILIVGYCGFCEVLSTCRSQGRCSELRSPGGPRQPDGELPPGQPHRIWQHLTHFGWGAGAAGRYGWGFPGGTPIAGWFTMESPISMDDFGGSPHWFPTPIFVDHCRSCPLAGFVPTSLETVPCRLWFPVEGSLGNPCEIDNRLVGWEPQWTGGPVVRTRSDRCTKVEDRKVKFKAGLVTCVTGCHHGLKRTSMILSGW